MSKADIYFVVETSDVVALFRVSYCSIFSENVTLQQEYNLSIVNINATTLHKLHVTNLVTNFIRIIQKVTYFVCSGTKFFIYF